MTKKYIFKKQNHRILWCPSSLDSTTGKSLVLQQLGLHTLIPEGPGSLPGRETKTPQISIVVRTKSFSKKVYKQ